MLSFFERNPTVLETEDIQRFASILKQDLTGALGDYEMVIHPATDLKRIERLNTDIKETLQTGRVYPEPGTGVLYLPLIHQGRALALVKATPRKKVVKPKSVLEMLPALIDVALDKLLLYKINILDRETGFYNDDYLRGYIEKNLETLLGPALEAGQLKPLSLETREAPGPITVLLADIRNFDTLADGYGRLEASRALSVLGQWLKEALPGPGCLARMDRGRLGLVLLRETLDTARQAAADLMARCSGQARDGELPKLKLAFGLAGFPQDYQDEPGAPEGRPTLDSDPAGLLVAKAELALHHAATHRERRVLAYRDLLRQAGRVVQTLPYGRVVMNLGRRAGASEGQVYIVEESRQGENTDYKGEVALFEVHDDFSLGEIINLRSSLDQLQPDDRLAYGQRSIKDPARSEKSAQGLLDPLLGLPDHQTFKELLLEKVGEESAENQPFTIIMLQVDGYDRYRFTMGSLESDRQFKALYGLIQESLPEKCLAGRYSSDSLCFFCPNLSEADALERARSWRDTAAGRHRQTVTIGLAAYPRGPFTRMDILTNAQKALEHATFFGPSSVAAFDSVSLNISGDKRFEAGDFKGAIAEYLNALELNAQDLNVLNSLGVCYGHVQKHDLAKDTFHKVLTIDPRNLMAHYNLGFALAMDGKHREALESFRQAAAAEPRNFDILFQMGKMALELDLVDEALSCFEKAAASPNRRAIVFRYLGQTLLKTERIMEAIDAFKAAVRHDPEDAPSLSQLGILFLEQGTDLDVALSLTTQSVELDPTNNLFRQRRARILAASGDLEEADIEYKKVVDMGTCTREVYYEYGRVMEALDRPDDAGKWYQASLDQDKEYRPALEALALLKGR